MLALRGATLVRKAENKILCLIPARAGSKRLTGKNLKLLNGKPLVAWTIEAALQSSSVVDVVVSTESSEIANIAIEYGASVPFIRPSSLAEDDTSSIAVVLDALHQLQCQGKFYDQVILLQPTSPLRTAKEIDAGVDFYFHKGALAVIGVCEVEHHPFWSNKLPADFSMENFLPEQHINLRSQDLPLYYRINGAFYMADVREVIKQRRFFLSQKIFGFLMSRESSVDIDTKLDFILADILLKNRTIYGD